MDHIIKVVKTFIPSDRWPEVQAMLSGETPVPKQQAGPVKGIRVVEIDDMSDEDGD
jgi:hypothetical protein